MFDGLLNLFNASSLLFLMAGSLGGLIIGVLPGLGPVFALSLFLPLTFSMPAVDALIFLGATYASCVYGGSISAILINTPGTPGSIATCFDGYPMAKKGEGGKALGIATTGSFVGGILGVLALAFIGPMLAEWSLLLGPAEYFMLTLAGLSLVAVAGRGDTKRGLIMGGFGLMLSFFGRDVITGTNRFTFGIHYLEEGIAFVPFVIGVFALSQAMILADEKGSIAKAEKVGGMLEGVKEVFKRPVTLIRSSVLGVVLGIMPGVGINVSNFVAYLVEKRCAKDPDSFGKGDSRGLMAPEIANNASSTSTLIPAFALGIPGGSSAAIFLGAMMIHGLRPGHAFFTSPMIPTLIWGFIFGQIAFLIFGVLFANYFAKLTLVPNGLLVPIVGLLSFVGAFAYRNSILDVLLMLTFGFLGYLMVKNKFPLACMVLGIILGNMAESNFFRAIRISHGSYSIFFTRPISLVLFIVVLFVLVSSFVDLKGVLGNAFKGQSRAVSKK